MQYLSRYWTSKLSEITYFDRDCWLRLAHGSFRYTTSYLSKIAANFYTPGI